MKNIKTEVESVIIRVKELEVLTKKAEDNTDEHLNSKNYSEKRYRVLDKKEDKLYSELYDAKNLLIILKAIQKIPLNYQVVFTDYLQCNDYKILYDLFLQNNTKNQYDDVIKLLNYFIKSNTQVNMYKVHCEIKIKL